MSVVVEKTGAVLVITINRPSARNAIDRTTALAIAEAADQLDGDPSVAVGVLTGAGGTFCAGMDLKAFLDAAPGERPAEIDGRGFGGITQTPPATPLIAAVEGYALAGGCELALACDLIVASSSARFGLPEVTRGLVAGAGGLVRLPRRIPAAIAMEHALTGAHMSADVAHRWGLVNRLSEPGQALTDALTLAHEIAANAPMAVRASKAIMIDSADWTMAESWDRQRPLADSVIASDDAREGAAAFAEKRAPRWTGR
jgi:enoyl-CoA hydratase